MQLSEHFTLQEFTASETAQRRGLDNSLPPDLLNAAQDTAAMMERIRAALGGLPITVTSGYRSLAVNRAIGSSDSSDHVKALAVDFKCPDYGSPFAVATELAARADPLGLGQIIYEFGSWVHVSTRRPSNPVNRIITIDGNGTRVGIVK